MNYICTIGDKEIKITVQEVGIALYKVMLDGQEHLVDVHHVQKSVWSVLYENASFEVDLYKKDDEFEVLIAGDHYKFSLANEQRKALMRYSGVHPKEKALLTAPMPGSVVKLLVNEGDKVKANQGVIVIEAMKMENELKATHPGKIQKIFVKEGEMVETGAKLLQID